MRQRQEVQEVLPGPRVSPAVAPGLALRSALDKLAQSVAPQIRSRSRRLRSRHQLRARAQSREPCTQIGAVEACVNSSTLSFDDLVGVGEEGGRDVEAESVRDL